MSVTPEKIEARAVELHLARSQEEKSGHRQHIVPWNRLGETFKLGMLQIAKEQLESEERK